MGVFSKINTVSSAGSGGIFFPPGFVGVAECRSNKMVRSRKGKDLFIAEFTITESNMPERPVGSPCSWVVTIDPAYLETALGNIKGYCASLYDIPENEVDEPGVEAMIAADNPGAGRKVRVTATNITKRNGDPFTKVVFTSV